MFEQYEITELVAVVDAANHAAAASWKNIIDATKGTICSVSLSIAGVAYDFRDVHVDNAEGTVFPGPAVGNGATGTAHVVARFILSPTDFT